MIFGSTKPPTSYSVRYFFATGAENGPIILAANWAALLFEILTEGPSTSLIHSCRGHFLPLGDLEEAVRKNRARSKKDGARAQTGLAIAQDTALSDSCHVTGRKVL